MSGADERPRPATNGAPLPDGPRRRSPGYAAIGAACGAYVSALLLVLCLSEAVMLAAGAVEVAACAFVIAWTLIGLTRAIVWELPFFGVDFVTWRIIFSLPMPILAGLAARALWKLAFKPGDGA